MWCFVTVGTRRSSALWRTKYVQITVSSLLIFLMDATSKPYGYLVLDHYPSTPENQTIVTNILPGEQLTYYTNSHAKVKRQ